MQVWAWARGQGGEGQDFLLFRNPCPASLRCTLACTTLPCLLCCWCFFNERLCCDRLCCDRLCCAPASKATLTFSHRMWALHTNGRVGRGQRYYMVWSCSGHDCVLRFCGTNPNPKNPNPYPNNPNPIPRRHRLMWPSLSCCVL